MTDQGAVAAAAASGEECSHPDSIPDAKRDELWHLGSQDEDILRSLGAWLAIREGETGKKDQGALAAISQTVLDDVMMAIAEKETAKEAWDALKEMRIGEDRVKKARVKRLKGN